MDRLNSMTAMYPHLYGAVSSPATSLPIFCSPVLNPFLSRLSDTPYLQSGVNINQELPASTSRVKVSLEDKDLWQQFHMFGTEMIVTRSGRRMFPILKVRLDGLDPQKKYIIILDLAPLGDARYKFCNGQWTVSGRAEPHFPSRLFIHPDSPASGKHWMDESVVSFHRVKLTNNNKDHCGNLLLNSMHRYQPRILVVQSDDVFSVKWQNIEVFTFPETSFFAVTAYQNESITRLKIDNNPFAKGFRDREKIFPQKRSAPFIEQLREAANTEMKQKKEQLDDSEMTSSEDKRTPPTDAKDSLVLYNNTKFELLRQQLALQYEQNRNQLLSNSVKKLPISIPFTLFPNHPCS